MSRTLLLAVLAFIGIALSGQRLLAQVPYDLPNDNSACPSNCRQIPWQAGSDLWNGGTLPNYTSVTCSPLNENGSTDDTTNLQSCIDKATAGTSPYNTCAPGCAVFIPSGTVYINGIVRLKSNVVVRGNGPTNTFINLGASGRLDTVNFGFGNISPQPAYNTLQSTYTLSGTPQKGDTTLTIGSGTVSVGTWIEVFGNDNPALITATGTDGHCNWCGDGTGFYLQQQIVQVTGFVSGSGGAGSVVNISRPLYYPPDTTSRVVPGPSGSGTVTEPAGAKYEIVSFQTQRAGFENFKVTATGDIGANSIIMLQGCLYCWVEGVETQNTGSSSGSAHIHFQHSYGGEVRDSYVHDGLSSASGANYGIYFEFTNGDHKIENNIMRHNRHGIVYQGGGSGTAILYNYMDDNFTDDLSYLGSARTSHGAHPYMNLFEGNVISHIAADDFWGSSSHLVFFRNWLWGDETGTGVPSYPPQEGYDAVDLFTMQTYYSFVGNVLGRSPSINAQWPNATLRGFNEYASAANPIVYSYGTASGTIPSASTTSINHGNYDYKTNGVAYWDGGSNHTLKTSMYYSTQPSFLANCSWPSFGPDLSSITNQIPAVARYNGTDCSGGSGGGPPRAPSNLTGSVH